MKSIPAECQENTSDSKILLKENKSQITFSNPDKITVQKIKVDGCAIKDNQVLRCDYALIPREGLEIYIELKGCDISHAIDQIASTIKQLSDDPVKLKKLCIIVSTHVSPALSTKIQNRKSQFNKRFNAELWVKNTPATYKLKDLST